jgi:DNA-binding MarR family transcriptional regulator
MAQILMLRKAHFFSLDNDLIDVHAKVIGSTALSVYVALARFVNRKTGECWPSIGRLASLLDLARNTVKAALRTLEAAGLIAIRRRRDPAGDATSHLYTLLDASPAAVQIRLAQRHRAAVEAPETGRAPDDPPPVSRG